MILLDASSIRSALLARLGVLLVSFSVIFSWVIYRCYVFDQAQSGGWGCEMSWMTPTYSKIDWDEPPSSRYALWLYREQGWDEHTAQGHPVLFVPGNAGSFQQVRSIASSASRQYHGHPGGRADDMLGLEKLDFFTVDFREDLSALHAGTLREQASYLSNCVHRVLAAYSHLPAEDQPRRVSVLAHSMGGIVARLALAEQTTLPIDILVTLSSPHQLPPINLDREMDRIYQQIDSNQPKEVALVSLCGGVSDTQIVSDACALPKSYPRELGFAIFTSGIPGAWTGVDHQAMVWCHQIRLMVARALLEMSSKTDTRARLAAAEHWLSTPLRALHAVVDVQSERIPIETANMTLILRSPHFSTTSRPFWRVRHCFTSGPCEEVEATASWIPIFEEAAPFPVPGEGSRAEDAALCLDMALSSETGWLEFEAAKGFTVITGSRQRLPFSGVSLNLAGFERTSHLVVELDQIVHSLLVYKLVVRLQQCQGSRPVVLHTLEHPKSTFESRFYPTSERPMYLHLHSGSAPYLHADFNSMLLEIFQQENCALSNVTIRLDLWSSVAKLALRYRSILLAWPLGWTAVFLWHRMMISPDGVSWSPMIAPSNARLTRVVLMVVATITLGGLMQCMMPQHVTLQPLLLGNTELRLLPLLPILGLWTLGLSILYEYLFWGTLTLIGRIALTSRAYYDKSSTPMRSDSNAIASSPRIAIPTTTIILVAIAFPQQLGFLALFSLLCLHCATRPADNSKISVEGIMRSLAVIFSLLLPLNLAPLAVWTRNLWLDWRHPFRTDHNVLGLIPLLLAIETAYSRPGLQIPQKWAFVASMSLPVLFVSAFLVGGRWPSVVLEIAQVAASYVLCVVWIATRKSKI
ncbi:PGAP1-like protein-domain-containing protein [Naematelia encephala]|uniref:GPI inositol-deacylase n=1 Tax=Naematelia encephala TaxID=71784 RepID=A0A1Y2B379_9TREE|nr:PGAP1-like protein-domain-containing protein [Naematelia encephala]